MKKTQNLNIRIKPEIKKLLKKLSEHECRTQSEELEHLVLKEAKKINVK